MKKKEKRSVLFALKVPALVARDFKEVAAWAGVSWQDLTRFLLWDSKTIVERRALFDESTRLNEFDWPSLCAIAEAKTHVREARVGEERLVRRLQAELSAGDGELVEKPAPRRKVQKAKKAVAIG